MSAEAPDAVGAPLQRRPDVLPPQGHHRRVGRQSNGGLLEAVAALDNLNRAWSSVQQRSQADLMPRPALRAFAGAAAANLQALADDVLQARYRPLPLIRVEIPKPGGGRRRLSIPPVRDRVLERALHQVLEPILDPVFLPWSFGYRTGLSIHDAIRCVLEERDHGAMWAVRCDFADCFDSLRRSWLVTAVSAYVHDRRVLALLGRLLGRSVRIGFRLEHGLTGVPQGSSLSPLLCNLYLNTFDEGMLACGWRPIRYADDSAPRAQEEIARRRSGSPNAVLCWRWRWALRDRPAGGGLKPPRAAAVKSRGGERRGKGARDASGVSREGERE